MKREFRNSRKMLVTSSLDCVPFMSNRQSFSRGNGQLAVFFCRCCFLFFSHTPNQRKRLTEQLAACSKATGSLVLGNMKRQHHFYFG